MEFYLAFFNVLFSGDDHEHAHKTQV